MLSKSRIVLQLGCSFVLASALLMDSANQVQESSSTGGGRVLSDLAEKYRFMREDDGTINVDAVDYRLTKNTALHKASENGDVEDVRLLLANGASMNGRGGVWGDTPLHRASRNGHDEVVRLLLANGANVHVKDAFGHCRFNLTPLHWASHRGHDEVVRLLIANGADVNDQAKGGFTPLHGAATPPDTEPDINHKHETPLHGASSAVIHVLVANGADLLHKNEDGKTPFDYAREYNKEDAVAVLEHYESLFNTAKALAVATGTKCQDGLPVLVNKKTKALVPGHKNVNHVVSSFLRSRISK